MQTNFGFASPDFLLDSSLTLCISGLSALIWSSVVDDGKFFMKSVFFGLAADHIAHLVQKLSPTSLCCEWV
jgi:hypothetical protein